MQASFSRYILNFKRPGGTSRGILKTKETFFLILERGGKQGVGECGLFRGLSIDDRQDYEEKLQWVCDHIHEDQSKLLKQLQEFPSIQFGLEQALMSLENEHPFELFPSDFTQGKDAISINGLIWMGSPEFMKLQIIEKLKDGFTTLKLKIGALDFNSELDILKYIRQEFSNDAIELRVDANGAFSPNEALEKLKWLSDFNLHSIEQPIKAQQRDEMAELCLKSPLDIALDEELIGVFSKEDKQQLINDIRPQYIILKPSLVGGFQGSIDWIDTCNKHNISWWITSALESNVGLSAISQFTYQLNVTMPQGLGTGALFTNNFKSPLQVLNGKLHYNPEINWKFAL